MSKFLNNLKKYRSSRNKEFNFQSSQGGVFLFRSLGEFFEGFVAAYPKYTPEMCSSLVFRPRRDLNMNCTLDFDFKGRDPTNFARRILQNLQERSVKLWMLMSLL